jgi:hypothetical protein
VDPATLALNAATALTAALTLFFSRFDSRHQRTMEPFDLKMALWDLSMAIDVWAAHARTTSRVMQSWARGQLDDKQAAIKIDQWTAKDALGRQIAALDEVIEMLGGEGRGFHSGYLRNLLRVYGPEVLEALESGIGQRRELIETLRAELPVLRAGGPKVVQAAVTQLESTCEELTGASRRLDAYLRVHFPLKRTSTDG